MSNYIINVKIGRKYRFHTYYHVFNTIIILYLSILLLFNMLS